MRLSLVAALVSSVLVRPSEDRGGQGRREPASWTDAGDCDPASAVFAAAGSDRARAAWPLNSAAMETTITGGCLCGGVRFEATLPFSDANYCHCSRCRKHAGSEFESGSGAARAIPAARRRGVDHGLPSRRRQGRGVLLGLRFELSAASGRGTRSRSRLGAMEGESGDQARLPCLCRLGTTMGAGTGRRSSALRGGLHPPSQPT